MMQPRRGPRGILAFGILLASCGGAEPAAEDPVTANQRVAAELEAVYAASSPRENSFLNARRVEMLEALPLPSSPQQRFGFQGQLAEELLYAGRTREALDLWTAMDSLFESPAATDWPSRDQARAWLDANLALSWLRLGEQENCLANPASATCVVPISEEGWHQLEEGSRNAIVYYQRMLERDPDDLNSRWLLNLAHTTLGEYPRGVPERWRIPREAFASEADIGQFLNIGPHLGVDVRELSGGAIAEDFDGDGLLDLMTSSWHLNDQLRLFRNEGDGSFTDVTAAAALTGITGGLNLQHADYDNDGFVDVLVLRGAWMGEEGLWPNSLLRNNGDGTFTDVTVEAGLGSRHPTQTAVWTDVNLDGWIDLYIGNETTGPIAHPSELFLSNGDGTFREVASEAGAAAVGFIKGVTAGDVDNDGYPELYVSRNGQPNLLLQNQGPGPDGIPSFVDVAEQAGVEEPVESFPTWFWDFDNDGWLDLFVSGYRMHPDAYAAELLGLNVDATLPRLYRNLGDGTFEDVTEAQGMDRLLYTMGSNYGDFDNDGWLDMLIGTGDPDYRALMPNRAFLNDGGLGFREITVSGGFGNVQKGHSVTFGDVNRDGTQDIYMNFGGALEGDGAGNAFYGNPGHGHSWITLRLSGTDANRFAIGARVRVIAVRPDGTRREIHRVVGSGGSFGSNSLQMEIGLGDAQTIESVQVIWPSAGSVQLFESVEVNSVYQVREGDAAPGRVSEDAFAWPTGLAPASSHDHPGGMQ